MNEDEPAIVSGDIENIVIKPESIELLFDVEESFWSEEYGSEDSDPEVAGYIHDECCFVTKSGEVVTINNEDVVQTPFYLENYFMDNDGFRSRSPVPIQQFIVKVDRVTCYRCDIVFCNEHRLLEHLMTHIDVYRMGCDICDKDLNLEEKFQLHMMAVTWQSIYYCDFCRKSCAGVVRSKSQLPPPGKTYMCHDCEYQTKETVDFQISVRLNVMDKQVYPTEPPPLVTFLPQPVSATVPPTPLPPPAEVLQEQKQKPISEVKFEEYGFFSAESSPPEVQDCYVSRKPPTKKKENKNKKCRRPRRQSGSVKKKKTSKTSSRSRRARAVKAAQNFKCHYCPSTFVEELGLVTHTCDKHKFHKLMYVCQLCGKEFLNQRSLENHVSFHQLAKDHMCFVCDLSFLSKFELEQHACIHRNNAYCDQTDGVALDLRKKAKSAA